MPVDSFRFVSPGVFINEIDQSQIPALGGLGTGPVIFGVAEKGPAMVPVTVRSFDEFIQIFGNPQPGADNNSDIWRNGDYSNPTYGAYAAQAYLANGSPLTYVRLVGDQAPGADGAGLNGWDVPSVSATGGAYGLFMIASGTTAQRDGTLAAIFYLSGSDVDISISGSINGTVTQDALAAALMDPETVGGSPVNSEFRIRISGSNEVMESTFNFNPKSGRYIRKVFNTNAHLLNAAITDTPNRKDYFLGETYERSVIDYGAAKSADNFEGSTAVILGLITGSIHGGDFQRGYATPATPWIVGQDLTDQTGFPFLM